MVEGQFITPTLRLVRALGRGGMGSVWVADHLALHTQVAVKFMYAKFAQNPDFVRRFQTEAIAAAAIKSPHVAQVFDHGITEDYEPYIVMELLEGEDLRTRLKRTGPLAPAELAPILTQAAKALTRAHSIGIVHRDIKPDNVFLTNVGDETFVKILDFGIAKLSDETSEGFTMTGNTLGTPYYMSPEQLLSSKAVDFRSDLWSLGVVAYQALTGARPFRGETIGAVSVAVNAGSFALPSTARTGLSPSIDAWVKRALQRDPMARFGSAREMAEAFEAAVRAAAAAEIVDLDSLGAIEEPPSAGREGVGVGLLTPDPTRRTSTGPTLAGTAQPGTPAPKSRTPLFAAVGALALAGTVAAVIVMRPTRRPEPTPATQPPAGAEPTTIARAPEPVPSTSATAQAAQAGQAIPTAASTLPAGININDLPSATSAPAVAAGGTGVARPTGGAHHPGAGHAPGKPAPAPAAGPPPSGNKDTIGF